MYQFLKNKNVLYIDDDIDVLENINSTLSNFFKNFHIASSGKKAYDIFYSEQIDIIFVDIELGDINGIDFIKDIRKNNSTISIIIISAYTKTSYLLNSIELNLTKYIVKPLTTDKMYEILTILNNNFIEKSTIVINNISYKTTIFSQKELEFLTILLKKNIITYDEIDLLWIDTPSQNAQRQFIKHLREKLEDNILKNKSGLGYFLNVQN